MPFTYRKSELDEGKEYISNKKIPSKLTAKRDRDNFAKKWKSIKIVDNKLMQGDKEIILKEDISAFLSNLYNDVQYGYVGRDKLFPKIQEKYLNISQRDVNNFLKNHETNQVHQPIKKVIASRPVRTKKALSVWYADLIIINKKKEEKREISKLDKVILTVVDAFSKYAWVRVISGTKDAKTVADQMEDILIEESPNWTAVLHTDNGSEFKGAFEKVLNDYGIKHRTSRAYTPSDASIVERFNKTIKTMWAKYTTQTGDTSLDKIQELVNNYNTNIHSSTKKRPVDLHPNKNNKKVDKKDIKIARRQIDKRIKKSVAKQKELFPNTINVGDFVRIDYRIDEGLKGYDIFRKKYLRQWSFRVFKVIRVSRPSRLRNQFYILQFENGDPIVPERRFSRNELLKVDISKLERPIVTNYVGKYFKMYFEKQKKWYYGQVLGYDHIREVHKLKYHGGGRWEIQYENLQLTKDKWKFVTESAYNKNTYVEKTPSMSTQQPIRRNKLIPSFSSDEE